MPVTVPSSAVPGRIRLRVDVLKGQDRLASNLAERVTTDGGVYEARASALTGSLLIRFDPARVNTQRIASLVRRHARALTSGHHRDLADHGVAWHALPATEVARRLTISTQHGLSAAEAAKRLDTVGAHRLPVTQPKTTLEIVAGHVNSLPVLLLGGLRKETVHGQDHEAEGEANRSSPFGPPESDTAGVGWPWGRVEAGRADHEHRDRRGRRDGRGEEHDLDRGDGSARRGSGPG